MILCSPSPLPDEVRHVITRWTETQNSRLFTFIHAKEDLDRTMVDRVCKERKHYAGIETLDVLIDSGGGDIEAAYQLTTFLRRRCKKLRVFVPDWAKSASTLIALGADEIWMSDTAELGPLDAQIPDPRDPNEFISALEEFRAIDYLRNHGYEILDELAVLLLRRARLKIRDVLDHAIQYATQIMAPLYSQVDPLYFGGAHRALEMSIEYGKRVMSRYAYRGWSTKRIEGLLKELTWNYPSHTFVIDYIEVERLGLEVRLLTGELEEWAHAIIGKCTECIGLLEADVSQKTPAPIEKQVSEESDGQKEQVHPTQD